MPEKPPKTLPKNAICLASNKINKVQTEILDTSWKQGLLKK